MSTGFSSLLLPPWCYKGGPPPPGPGEKGQRFAFLFTTTATKRQGVDTGASSGHESVPVLVVAGSSHLRDSGATKAIVSRKRLRASNDPHSGRAGGSSSQAEGHKVENGGVKALTRRIDKEKAAHQVTSMKLAQSEEKVRMSAKELKRVNAELDTAKGDAVRVRADAAAIAEEIESHMVTLAAKEAAHKVTSKKLAQSEEKVNMFSKNIKRVNAKLDTANGDAVRARADATALIETQRIASECTYRELFDTQHALAALASAPSPFSSKWLDTDRWATECEYEGQAYLRIPLLVRSKDAKRIGELVAGREGEWICDIQLTHQIWNLGIEDGYVFFPNLPHTLAQMALVWPLFEDAITRAYHILAYEYSLPPSGFSVPAAGNSTPTSPTHTPIVSGSRPQSASAPGVAPRVSRCDNSTPNVAATPSGAEATPRTGRKRSREDETQAVGQLGP